jgi:hypothetical protein
LAEINNEAKARRITKSQKLGEARVISYEDLEKARAARAAEEAAKEAKKTEREAKKAQKEAKKDAKKVQEVASATLEIEEKRGRNKTAQKRKSPAEADAPESKAKVARMSGTQIAKDEIAPTPWRAPVARMY